MASVGFTGTSPLKLATKCIDAGLYFGKGVGQFRKLTLGLYHLFIASSLVRLVTLYFVCSNYCLAIFFAYALPIIAITCVSLSL